jgi:hypothetical protein
MHPDHPDADDGVIRITHAEAMSKHVDDLLKRQMSLRGEAGVTRDRNRAWYYQNWFLFMVAGTFAAVAAWALLEPYFDDLLYIQGPLQQINVDEPLKVDRDLLVPGGVQGAVTVNGQKVWLLPRIKELRADGSKPLLDPASLRLNQEVGLYVEYHAGGGMELTLAHFLVPEPPPKTAKAALSLTQQSARHQAAALLFFPLIGGLVGLAIGSVDGLVCRLFRRALLAGAVGFLVGVLGSFVCSLLAELAYAPLHSLARGQMGPHDDDLNTFAFLVQMTGRAVAWGLAGMAMGLGQGIALRSGRLLLYGFVGGIIGGLLGGMLFDPIHFFVVGRDAPSGHWSRLIGFACIGATVGAMIGIVELLARDAWLRMVEGSHTKQPTLVNGRPVQRARLRHGDRITIGRTVFVYQKRHG